MKPRTLLRTLDDVDLDGKKVFLRLDLNVPLKDGKITDETRIQAALPTLRYILERTGKVAIASHLGRPKGEPKPEYSLEPVGARLAELLDREVVFSADYATESPVQVLDRIDKQQFMLLENTRFHPGETANDKAFCEKLAKGFDVYVNDAFGTVHRAHASTVGIAELFPPESRAAGLLVEREIEALQGALEAPEHPFTVVMGGAKVADKIAVILNLLTRCNNLLVGGAMAYTFLKFRGEEVGNSRVEEDQMDQVEAIFRNAEARNVTIHLPQDHVAVERFEEGATPIPVDGVAIPKDLMALDIGPLTAARFGDAIRSSRTVIWNGPMGVFEWDGFEKGTLTVAKAVAQCTELGGRTIVGGGDSVAAVNQAGVADKISHISTGGGASLEWLEGKSLPGLKVLVKEP